MLLVKMSLNDFIRKFRTTNNSSSWLGDEPLTKLYHTLESLPPVSMNILEHSLVGGYKLHHFSDKFPTEVDKIAMKNGSLKDLYDLLVEQGVGMMFTDENVTEIVILT